MKRLLLLALPFAIGCGTDTAGVETLPDLHVPPPPSNGMQIITPIFDHVEASKDYEVCTWTDKITTETTDIRSTLGYQTEPPGHHVIVFYTMEHQPPGTSRICTDTDMATFRMVAGSGANGELNEAPGDLVYRIPAGAQIVVNEHFLNSTDRELKGQSAINLNFADPGKTYTRSSALAVLNTGLDVQTGESTQRVQCTFDRPLKLWYMIPHEHRWGSHIKVDLTRSGTPENMFDLDWADEYTFHPPEKRIDPATPLMVNAGDTITIDCSWNNTTGHDLAFGFEMCVAFGEFVDDAGIGGRQCDNAHWGEL